LASAFSSVSSRRSTRCCEVAAPGEIREEEEETEIKKEMQKGEASVSGSLRGLDAAGLSFLSLSW
jgi:hypothetical protein